MGRLFVSVWEVSLEFQLGRYSCGFSTLIERTEGLSSNAAESVNLRFEP